MAHNLFIGTGNTAKKARQGYIGVNGVAKKILKVYIGDANGKARTVFTEGGYTIVESGIASLNEPKYYHSSASMANTYAAFVGGTRHTTDLYNNTIDLYDANLTKTTVANYFNIYNGSKEYVYTASATTSNVFSETHLITFGGTAGSMKGSSKTAGIDSSFTSIVTKLGSIIETQGLVGISSFNNTYAVFANGGTTSSNSFLYDQYVIHRNKSLTSGSFSNGVEGYNRLGGKIGSLMILLGGLKGYSNSTSTVTSCEMYNTSFTKTSTITVTGRAHGAVANTGRYIIFAGGYQCDNALVKNPLNTIEVFDSSGTKISTSASLSVARYYLAGGTSGNNAYFAGGTTQSNPSSMATTNSSNTVDIFNDSLTRSTTALNSLAKRHMETANVGDYLLFAGGATQSAAGESTSTMAHSDTVVAIKN